MKRHRASGLVVLLSMCSVCWAQAWPERPITLIVPFPAGGGVDAIARPFAGRMGELLGRPVVVVPRDGASGTIGTAAVAASKPDGCTLAFTASGPLTIQPHVIPTLPCRFDGLVPLKVAQDERYRAAVRQASQEPLYRSASDYARVLADDFAQKRDVVRQAGIRAP